MSITTNVFWIKLRRCSRSLVIKGSWTWDCASTGGTVSTSCSTSNWRVGAQFRLFVDEQDVDVVRAQHLDLTGRPIPWGHPVDGRAFIVEHMDLIAGLGKYRQAGLAPRNWYRSIRDVDEAGWWSADDMLPAEVFVARMAGRLTARAGRRLWRGGEGSPAASHVRPKPVFYPGRRESRVKSLLRARGPERSSS